MRNRSPAPLRLLMGPLLCAAAGAQCHQRDVGLSASYGPRVLTQTPTLDELIQSVNRNSALVRSLYTTDATMTVPGALALRANLALERPRNVRLRAETALTGAEIDMGSNDERFWFWLRRNNPPTLYHCRHDQFASSAARQLVPVDPEWLIDAVGLATLDPAQRHSPPQRNPSGHWEIRTAMTGPGGPMTKVMVVDEARAFVLQQHLFDERGTLVASATTSRHWRDPATGAIVPQQIDVNWPATQFTLRFDVRSWIVNSIPADRNQLFTMPSYPGWAVVDLADPNLRFQASPAGPSSPFTSPAAAMPGVSNSPAAVSPGAGNLVAVPWNGQGIAATSARPATSTGDLIGWFPPTAGYRSPAGYGPPAAAPSAMAVPSSSGAVLAPAGSTPATSLPGVRRY